MTRRMKGFIRKGGRHSTGRRLLYGRFGGRTIVTMLTVAVVILFALPAGALEPITIPTDTVIRGAEGEVHVLAEVPTGTEAGCEATVSAVSHNNPSVHVGNDIIISSGGASVVISDIESAAGAEMSAQGTLPLSETIVVSVRLGPKDEVRANSIFSGGVTVAVSCVSVTTSSTTTTTTTTTTTVPPTTTTTVPPTTSTTAPPPTRTPEPPTKVAGISTTTLPPTTTVPAVSGSTLPFTGPEHMTGTAVAGGALLLLGLALRLAAGAPQPTD